MRNTKNKEEGKVNSTRMPRQQEHQDLKKKKQFYWKTKRENKNECGTKRGIHGGGNQKKDGGGRLEDRGRDEKCSPRGPSPD